ncbi:MAG: hypothetical protein C0622_00220 [Desulfuromonas sp.]|nr:MAG: hypothetical protein C0622_00220 [Desulfuromonas sp.]
MKRYLMATSLVLAVAGFSFAFPHYGTQSPTAPGAPETIQSGLSFALNNAPDRHAVAFVSQVSENRMTLVPLKTYQTSFGQTCRQYSFSYITANGSSDGVGVACQNREGNWEVITMQGDRGSVRNADASCPYASGQNPQLKGANNSQGSRYHSEEFLRNHRQQLERQKIQQRSGPMLVVN